VSPLDFLAGVAVVASVGTIAGFGYVLATSRRYDRETSEIPDAHGDVPAVPLSAIEEARARALAPPSPAFLSRCVHDSRGECATCYVARLKHGSAT
jgi:hypothetical protein